MEFNVFLIDVVCLMITIIFSTMLIFVVNVTKFKCENIQ